MSLSSATNRNDYTGSGATATYNYGYRIFDDDDLTVTVVLDATGVETTLVKTTDYTVTGVNAAAGGTIVLVDANQAWLDGSGYLLATYSMTIRRVMDIIQSTDIRNQGAFYPEIHENQMDKSIMIDQQQQDELDRSAKMPETVSAAVFNPALPASLPDNPGATVIVNDDGDGFELGPTADEISSAQDAADAADVSAAAALASETAAAASASSASTSASTATTQASTATTQASNAATSASTATTQATNAATSASTATTQAGIATTQAAAAVVSADDASDSADDAAASAAAAAVSAEQINRYETYATDAAFVSANGAAADGDAYYNTTSDKVRVYANSVWTDLGSGSGGGINYILNPNAETDTTGWATYIDAAGAAPVNGTGGSPNITLLRSTTGNVLRNLAAFHLIKTGANYQGEGCSYDFTIDYADRAKVLTVSFDWMVYSGTYVGGTSTTESDWTVYLYDVTNSRLIQPAPYKLDGAVAVDAPNSYKGTFQTSSDSSSYRLIIHTATSDARACSIYFDNVFVGPTAVNIGSAVSDWVSYTPVCSWVSNATPTGKWRRVGDSMHIRQHVAVIGTPTSATLTLALPVGYTMDTAKMNGTPSNIMGLGAGSCTGAGGGQSFGVQVVYSSTTTLAGRAIAAGSGANNLWELITQAAPQTFQSGDIVDFEVIVPIVGWASNSVMSSDTDTRVVSLNMTGNQTGTLSAAFNKVTFATVTKDSHGGNSASTYTVKVPGDYDISATVHVTAAGTVGQGFILSIFKGAVEIKRALFTAQVASTVGACVTVSTLGYPLLAGETIEIKSYNGITTTTFDNAQISDFSLARRGGPSQVTATETVTAYYTGNAPTGTLAGAYNTTTFGTKVKDSHSAYASGTYTVPVSGTYTIATATNQIATYVLNKVAICAIHVDGTIHTAGVMAAGGANAALFPTVTVTGVPLLAGQLVTIKSYNDATSPSFGTGAHTNFFSIVRTGNY